MSTYESLDELTKDLDLLVSSLPETTALDKLIEANKNRNEAEQIKHAYLKSKLDSNDQLQTELDELNRKTKELEEQLRQKKSIIMELQQETDRQRPNVEKLNKEYLGLVEQVQALEYSNRLIRDDNIITKVENSPTKLQLALYRGLGITLKVDNKERVTEAGLTSLDNQDIRIISLDDKSIASTANRIWNFIS